MIKYIIAAIGGYVCIVQILSINGFRFCKPKKRKKECRNLVCMRAKDCPHNNLYK